MNLALFAAALFMTVTAVAFVAAPLVRARADRNRGSVNVSLLGSIVVIGLGIALYGAIGRPDVQSHVPSAKTPASPDTATHSANGKVGSIASLLAGLESRLEENPDDAKGWLLLAQSYDALGRVQEARAAYDKATDLGITNDELAARLARVDEATANAPKIRGHVSLAPDLAKVVATDAVVYVIARADGSTMPLAVLRRSASELPFDFSLSDADSMVRGAGLTSSGALTISVKVSASGDALTDAAGLEATQHDIDPLSNDTLNIVIGKPGA